ncbi:hypothetical protein SASPL_154271 [Salvia splendens]|uniref:Cytoskeleton-associated protein 5 n=1 Tax=Salvia splendens TaxID=180675 RepID=A0A8X8YYJ7_SALSN|nr:hypothetical protein SASPL_154271 [Salvia splendens]
MKEWKNPKVLREKPILMVSVVDDFVTSHIKLKRRRITINIVTFAGTSDYNQSSAAATRNATVKLYEKFLYEASVAPTKSTSSAVTGGMDGLPREDISERISPTCLEMPWLQQKHMHESTLSTLDTWLGVAHPNKMLPYITALSIVDLIVCCCLQLPYITAVLTYAKVGAEERKDFFDWLSRKLPSLSEFPDVIQLLKPTAFAMADKSVDVRKSAACFNEILSVCGQETRVVPNKGYGQEYILSAQDINTNLKDSRKDYCFQIQIQDLEVSVLF